MDRGYILHGGGPTRSMLVEMVLAEAGAPYTLVEVDTRAGAQQDPAFLQLNPYGWVPALTTPDGETFGETPAINLWLCETHGLDLVPPPGDPLRPRFLAAFFNVTGEIEPTLKRVFFAHRYTLRPEETEAYRELAWDMLCDRMDLLETSLAVAGPFLLGARFTLADLTLGYWLAYPEAQGMLKTRPHLQALLDQTRSRPAIAPVFERLNGWIQDFQQRRAAAAARND